MRVALVAPPWLPVPPPAYGGTEAVIDTLARGLTAAGHSVLLVTTGDSTCPVEKSWVFEHARADEMGTTAVELRHLLHAYEAVTDVDVVHDHTIAGAVFPDRYGPRPVLITTHGPFTEDTKALYRSTASHGASVVAISAHHASTAGDVPIAGVVHHGLDAARYPVGAGDGGYLLFLGRMSPNKGPREAIAIARRTGMPLVIAAKMRCREERDYFDRAIAPHLGDDVTYAGEVGGAYKLELLGGAAALINPLAWDEPFGLCMIESMACGTPVIATRRGSVPEIVDDGRTGFLCTDANEMVAAVGRLHLIDRSACREAVEARFSSQRMTADYIALYEDVLTGRQAGLPQVVRITA